MSYPLAHCSWPPLPARYAEALRAAVTFVLGEVDPVGVVAAGTVVRGVHHASSDLDIYVVHETPVRRRVQRYFGDEALGPPVPAEVFINPPAAVRAYFAEEHADGRPLTAHMLVTGHVVLARGPTLAALREEAADWLARPSVPSEAARVRARYDAATRYEDAVDVSEEDPATSALLLARAVTEMLESWCHATAGAVPRGKDLLARVAALDPALGAAARAVFSDAPLLSRRAAAAEVADLAIGARGFFEWDSGPESVPAPPG